MASYRKKPQRDGFEVSFYDMSKSRRSIWLQGFSQRKTREFVRHLEELLRAKKGNVAPEADTAAWLNDLAGPLRDKLVSYGLADASNRKQLNPEERTVGRWTQNYIDTMAGSTWRTRNNYGQAREWLLKQVKESTDIGNVTAEDLKRWQRSMKDHLALATRNKHVQRAKAMFRAAVNDRVIRENPALELKEESPPNGRRIDRSRQFFVDASIAAKMLEKLPTDTWKLVFCLLRFQGMRRHEVLGLQWEHIDWAQGRLQVHSRKTGYRECPIFPETRQALRNASAEAHSTSTKVIPWTGSEDSLTPLLRKHVEQIVGECWPKVCQQLRSTRRTELDELFPSHVVDEWLGHDRKTAERHYQQVTPVHWSKAQELANRSTIGSTAGASTTMHTAEQTSGNSLFPELQLVDQYPRHDSNV